MSKLKKTRYNGFVYAYVIGVFLVVTLFSTLVITEINQAITENHIRSMSMKSYYLCYQAADATVASLTMDENELLRNLPNPPTGNIIHTDNTSGETIGESNIHLKEEYHEYYGKNKKWIVAYIETKIPDERVSHKGEDFCFEGSVMILADNSDVRIYNVNPKQFS